MAKRPLCGRHWNQSYRLSFVKIRIHNTLFCCKWIIWRIIYLNCEKDMKTWSIIGVIHNLNAVVKLKPEKYLGFEQDSNPWPLRYRCSVLPTEISSQLRAGHVLSSRISSQREFNSVFAEASFFMEYGFTCSHWSKNYICQHVYFFIYVSYLPVTVILCLKGQSV